MVLSFINVSHIINLSICYFLLFNGLMRKMREMGRRKEEKRKQGEKQEEKVKKGKRIKKHKTKKKDRKEEDGEDVKEQQLEEVREQRKKKKSKSKKKAKQHDSQVKQQFSVEQTFEEHKKPKKKHKKKESNLTQRKSQNEKMAIDLQSIKFQDDFPSSPPPPPIKKQLVSFEDSQRIIYIFSLDAGDYKGLRSQLPHLAQKNIRNHLTSIFESCIDKITERVKNSGRKIKEWEHHQRRQIIRELHRIRSSNRLLSEINVQFRQTFHKMMRTYNHPDIIITEPEITFLFRKIQAFVRGFNQLIVFRKNHYVPPDQQDETRKPIFQGGYIMQQKSKAGSQRGSQGRINPTKLVSEWSQQEEVEICKLYLANPNYQFIIENLRARFGESQKWKDFQIVGKKLDQVIKAGLNRLEELTAKPYNRSERILEEEKREKWKEEERKRLKIERVGRRFGDSIQLREGRVIKNPSLLLKQVFAHSGESYRVKHDLIRLLVERYPEESQLQATLQIIKEFTEWAAREEETNHVTMVRARLPVIDDGTKPKSMKAGSDKEGNYKAREDADLAVGLNLLEDLNAEEPLDKQQAPKPKLEFAQQKAGKVVFDVDQVKKQQIIQVFQSQESDYEGFLSSSVKLRT